MSSKPNTRSTVSVCLCADSLDFPGPDPHSYIITLYLLWYKRIRHKAYKAFFVRCSLKVPLLSLLNLSELSCDQVSMETKRVILARFVDFEVTQKTCYHGKHMLDFQKNSLIKYHI